MSGDEDEGGTASLQVAFDDRSMTLASSATFALLEDSAAITTTKNDLTVFVGIPRDVITTGTLSVGTRAGQDVTVWAQETPDQSPLIATEGTLVVEELVEAANGRFSARLEDAWRPRDSFGAEVRISGTVEGTWR